MRQLEDNSSDALIVLTALEALARLAWNDDEVREGVAQMEGRPFCLPHTHTHAFCTVLPAHTHTWIVHCTELTLNDSLGILAACTAYTCTGHCIQLHLQMADCPFSFHTLHTRAYVIASSYPHISLALTDCM